MLIESSEEVTVTSVGGITDAPEPKITKRTANEPAALEPGLYKHYEGGLYMVVGVALTRDDNRKPHVVYSSLGGEDGQNFWVTSLEEFTAPVPTAVGMIPRFVLHEHPAARPSHSM